ncbi:uncharacterized protein [Ptychodera flava]|uniref:uncharacterized protein n=1 Tax=Ptychodera flava TaxID=63121 RepID=UPI003969DDFD
MADNNNNNNNERRRKLAVFAGLLIQQTERKVLSHLFTHSQNVNQAITLACLRKDEKPRIEGYVESVIPRYDPDDFREHFRLSRESFEAVLTLLMECNEIPQPGQDGLRGKMPILIEKQLLIFLWYLGNNETFRSIADRFGVSMSTAHECWRRISKNHG